MGIQSLYQQLQLWPKQVMCGCFGIKYYQPKTLSFQIKGSQLISKDIALFSHQMGHGYGYEEVFYQTKISTPQSDIISPLFFNIALEGLDNLLYIRYRSRKSITSKSRHRFTINDYVKNQKFSSLRGYQVLLRKDALIAKT